MKQHLCYINSNAQKLDQFPAYPDTKGKNPLERIKILAEYLTKLMQYRVLSSESFVFLINSSIC